jgi:acylphosphatase
MKMRAHVIISGRVQGVFFRASTAREAKTLGLTGWVRNRPDGSVEAVFEGSKEKVEEMVAWCRKGPTAAKVARVETILEKPENPFTSFEVK